MKKIIIAVGLVLVILLGAQLLRSTDDADVDTTAAASAAVIPLKRKNLISKLLTSSL